MAIETSKVGAAVRGEFPIFEHTTYANSCSQGALSRRVRAAYEEYLDGWDENGAEWGHWVERAEAARGAFARLLGASPAEVAVTTSVSQGVSAIVSAIDLHARPRIVISEYEFPTVGQIAHAQELRGAEVVHVRPDADGSIPPERFAEAIDERTALVCCTTLSYRTGHRHEVAEIARLAHDSARQRFGRPAEDDVPRGIDAVLHVAKHLSRFVGDSFADGDHHVLLQVVQLADALFEPGKSSGTSGMRMMSGCP